VQGPAETANVEDLAAEILAALSSTESVAKELTAVATKAQLEDET
jgi:hypothetical protein